MALATLRLCRLGIQHQLLDRGFTTLSMSQAWRTKKIVPDVLDKVPPSKLGIQYPNVTINEGNIVHPKQTKDLPEISWLVQDESFYTICMTDPDAPSRSKPVSREWHHWLVVNIPGNKISEGETLSEYIGAGPPKDTGLHRYVFVLYAHKKKIKPSEVKLTNKSAAGRENFSIRKFAHKYHLGSPISGNFFEAEFDDYVPILHKQLGLN